MKQILKSLSVYYATYLILLMIVLGMLYSYPKIELHLLLNSCHSDIQDTFFKYYSMLAEWPLYVLMLLPLFWKRKELTFFYLMSELSGGAVVQILKRIFSAPRPVSVFEQYPDLYLPLVEGVHMHHSNSFPSGHTSTFFIFFTCTAIILAYHYLQQSNRTGLQVRIVFNLLLLLLLALAVVGGYSRIYLSQHFLSDVCVGSIIGVTIPCLMFSPFKNKLSKTRN